MSAARRGRFPKASNRPHPTPPTINPPQVSVGPAGNQIRHVHRPRPKGRSLPADTEEQHETTEPYSHPSERIASAIAHGRSTFHTSGTPATAGATGVRRFERSNGQLRRRIRPSNGGMPRRPAHTLDAPAGGVIIGYDRSASQTTWIYSIHSLTQWRMVDVSQLLTPEQSSGVANGRDSIGIIASGSLCAETALFHHRRTCCSCGMDRF